MRAKKTTTKNFLFLLSAVLFLSVAAHYVDAVTTNVECSWTGTASGNWGNANNWSCGSIPNDTCANGHNCFWVNIQGNRDVIATTTTYQIGGLIMGTSSASTLIIASSSAITALNLGTAPTGWLKGTMIVGNKGTVNLQPNTSSSCLTTAISAATTTVQPSGTVTSTSTLCTWDMTGGTASSTNAGTMSGAWNPKFGSQSFNNIGTINMTGGTASSTAGKPTIYCNGATNNFFNFNAGVQTQLVGSCTFLGNVTVESGGTLFSGPGTQTASSSVFNNGTLTSSSTGTWLYTSYTTTQVATGTFANVTFQPPSGQAPTYTLGGGGIMNVGQLLTVGNGTGMTFTVPSGLAASTSALTVNSTDTFTVNGLATTTGTVTLSGTINGTGTTTFGSPQFSCNNVPSGGTLNSNVRIEAMGANCTIPARTYGANLQLHTATATPQKSIVTFGAGTFNVSGAFSMRADSTGNLNATGTTNNPAVNITGNLDFTGGGAGSELLDLGTGNWKVTGSSDFTGGSLFTSSGGWFTMNGSGKIITLAGAGNLSNFAASSSITISGNATTTQNFAIDSAGTLTAPGSTASLYIGGNYINNGTFTHNSGTVYFSGSSAQTIQGATSTSAFNNVILSGTGGVSFASGNNASTSNLTINSGETLTAPTLMTIGGNYINNGTQSGSPTTLYFNGSSNQTISGATSTAFAGANWVFSGAGNKLFVAGNNASTTDFTIASGSGQVKFPSLLTISGNFANNGGASAFTNNLGTVYFTGTSKTLSGTMVGTVAIFNNVIFLNSGSWTFSNNATTSNFTISSGTVTAPSLLTILGNYTNNGTFSNGGGTVYFTGGFGSTLSGSFTGSSAFANVDFISSSFSFPSNASTSNLTIRSGVTLTAPTLLTIRGNYTNSGTQSGSPTTIYFDGSSPQTIMGATTTAFAGANWVFSGTGGVSFASGNNASTTNLTILGGTVDFSNKLVTIAGNYSNIGNIATTSATTFYFTGSSKTLSGMMTGSSTLPNLNFLNSGSWTFNNNASTTNFTITSGTVTAPPLLSLAGNYSNSGTFTANGGTVFASSSAPQTFSGTMVGAANAFYNLTILNNSGTNPDTDPAIIFANAASTTGTFSATLASTTFRFPASATSTFANFTINGQAANSRIWFRSSTAGVPWGLIVTGTQSVSYANVQDSYACAGSTISASDGTNNNSGNNSCWNFSGTPATIVSAANQVFSVGQSSTPISQLTVTAGTATGAITSANGLRIAIATSTVDMRWDTTDTIALFGGNASTTRVSNPVVSYEGGGSVLLIAVGSDFSSGEQLTVSGLNFTSFGTTVASSTALQLFLDGINDQSANAQNTAQFVAITGTHTIADATAGQEKNQLANLQTGVTVSNAPLFSFRLVPASESASTTKIVVSLSGVVGYTCSSIANLGLYVDYNSNNTVDAGETATGTPTCSISGSSGTFTFDVTLATSTAQNFIVQGDISGNNFGNTMTIALSAANVTTRGQTSNQIITVTGSVTNAIQSQQSTSGGGASAAGSVSPSEIPTYGATTQSGGTPTGGGAGGSGVGTGGGTGQSGGSPVDLVPSLLKPFAGIKSVLPWNFASMFEGVRRFFRL